MNCLAIIFSKLLIILLFFSLSSCLQEPAKIINKNKTNYNKSNQFNQDKYKNLAQNKAKLESKNDKDSSIKEDKKIEEFNKGNIIESQTKSKSSGKSASKTESTPNQNVPTKSEKSDKNDILSKKEIKVEQGDTLYSIAKNNNTNLRDIIELNHIEPPYQVKVGQKLKIPVATYHESRDGDTLYSISRLYNMKVNDLIAINDLKFPYAIYPGDKIKINDNKNHKNDEQKTIENTEIAEKNSKISNNQKNSPTASKEKILVDTKNSKEKSFNENFNKKDSDKNLVKTNITDKSSEIESYGLKPTEVRAIELSKADENSKTVKNIIPAQNQIVQTKLEINKPIDKDAIKKIANKSNHFSWPVRGEIVSKFGPKSAGLFNDGINIKAKAGQNVVASEDGIIAYVGNELKGYGNLVIIKHAGGWISAYAHLKDFAVNRGQKIYQGQKIGSVGDSGKVKYPQLYFGLRKGRDAVNPEAHLNHL